MKFEDFVLLPDDEIFRVAIIRTPVMTGKNEELFFVAVKEIDQGENGWSLYVTRPIMELNLQSNIANCRLHGDRVVTLSLVEEVTNADQQLLSFY